MAINPYTPETFAGGLARGLNTGYQIRARESQRKINEAQEQTRQEELERERQNRADDQALRERMAAGMTQGIPVGAPAAAPMEGSAPAAGVPTGTSQPAPMGAGARLDSLEAQALLLNDPTQRQAAMDRVAQMRTRGVIGQAAKARGLYQGGDMAGAVGALNDGWNLINPDAGSQFSMTEDGRIVTPDGQALDKQGMDMWFIEMGKAAQDPVSAMEWVREQRAEVAQTEFDREQAREQAARDERRVEVSEAQSAREEALMPGRLREQDMGLYDTADQIRSRRAREDIARIQANAAARKGGAKTGWKTTEIESMQKDMNDWVTNSPETFFTMVDADAMIDTPATANQILSDAKAYRIANPSDKMTREQSAMLAQLKYLNDQGMPLPADAPEYRTGTTDDGRRVVALGNKVFMEP